MFINHGTRPSGGKRLPEPPARFLSRLGQWHARMNNRSDKNQLNARINQQLTKYAPRMRGDGPTAEIVMSVMGICAPHVRGFKRRLGWVAYDLGRSSASKSASSGGSKARTGGGGPS